MSQDEFRPLAAGDPLEDLCRVCKTVRSHTVVAADSLGAPLRVICDYCGSQHNYRGGDARNCSSKTPERRVPVTDDAAQGGSSSDLESLLRRVIREEAGLTPVPMAEKWRGGDMILRPGKANLQEKSWPIETFFHKVVMLRNRLRVLEQQVNGSEMAEDLKIKLQGYITACYGTLTSFNILFAEEDDRFRGSSGND